MEFINQTRFPAVAFEGVDQYFQRFHVFVLRQTLNLHEGTLSYADIQEPLCEIDENDEEVGVRQESDLCLFKPNCDVVVNGVAYAPAGSAASFSVALEVERSCQETESDNALADPDGCYLANRTTPLISKKLMVSGASKYQRKSAPERVFCWLVGAATFGKVNVGRWRRSEPLPLTSLDLSYRNAYGGQVTIAADDSAIQRVPNRYLRNVNIQDRTRAAVHEAHAYNPFGAGFTCHVTGQSMLRKYTNAAHPKLSGLAVL